MMQGEKGMGGKSSAVGCRALIGLVMFCTGLATMLVAGGAAAGLLRQDPQGMFLLAGILCLVGVGVFASAAFRGGGRGQL